MFVAAWFLRPMPPERGDHADTGWPAIREGFSFARRHRLILSTFVIVYGRRRTALMILVGYAAGVLIDAAIAAALEASVEPLAVHGPPVVESAIGAIATAPAAIEIGVIGYIVPGLIAIWLDRQGLVPTLAALVTSVRDDLDRYLRRRARG